MNNHQNNFTPSEVIMAAYNNIDYTRTTLNGYARQSYRDFKIVIADDGSNDSTSSLVDEFKNKLNIRRIWQDDKGFRKSLILNKCLATSTADYIIFVDNDCIPHKHFIRDHLMCAKAKQCVTGRRINLDSNISRQFVNNISHIRSIENPLSLLGLIATNRVRDGGRGFYLPIFLSNILNKKRRGLLGSNMAAWRQDLIDINGFDSSFTGYGAEETDLEWRLEANGIRVQSLINRAIQFHLYHEQQTRTNTNHQRIREKKKESLIISPYGIKEAKIELENNAA